MEQVRLPDLEVIRRYSIAVRREHAPADEVLEVLEADVDAIKRALRAAAPRTRATPSRPAARRPAARTTRSKSRSGRRG